MSKKTPTQAVITGIIIGFIGTTLGTILWILLFSDFNIQNTIKNAWSQGLLGAILSAGSLLNLGSPWCYYRHSNSSIFHYLFKIKLTYEILHNSR